jgi:hypothetical protein
MAVPVQLAKCTGCGELIRLPRAVPAAQTASTCCGKPMKKLCDLRPEVAK